MRIKVTSSLRWDGLHRSAGDVFEVNDADGAWLIARGRAVEYTEPDEIDSNRAVGVSKSSSKTTKRSYKRKSAAPAD